MKFENTEVMNFEAAFRGLRNPMESWAKSDSSFGIVSSEYDEQADKVAEYYLLEKYPNWKNMYNMTTEQFEIWDKTLNDLLKEGILKESNYDDTIHFAYLGPKDINLAQRMIKAGESDSKFLRQIFVSVDITGPLYWWKELDTYKVGTTANSTSTMHKLASTPITKECFEMDDYSNIEIFNNEPWSIDDFADDIWEHIINICETLRLKYNETKDQRYWKELIRLLPESWLQTRTWTANYTILRNIYKQRKNHRLTEWHTFCNWVTTLPYANQLILYNN